MAMDPNRPSKSPDPALSSVVENQRVELAKLASVVVKQEDLLNRLTTKLNSAFSVAQKERHNLRDSTQDTVNTLAVKYVTS